MRLLHFKGANLPKSSVEYFVKDGEVPRIQFGAATILPGGRLPSESYSQHDRHSEISYVIGGVAAHSTQTVRSRSYWKGTSSTTPEEQSTSLKTQTANLASSFGRWWKKSYRLTTSPLPSADSRSRRPCSEIYPTTSTCPPASPRTSKM